MEIDEPSDAASLFGLTEGLVMTAPKNAITLTARSGERAVTGALEAIFMIGDFPERGLFRLLAPA
jgi:hypothetical protein